MSPFFQNQLKRSGRKSKFAPIAILEGNEKGEWVGNWAELRIVYKSGEEDTIWANTNYLIENDKIVRSITLYNEADMLRRLGYEMLPPQY